MTSLRQRLIEDMQIRNLAVGTQQVYVQQVALFVRYFNKPPELLGPEQIRTYQVYLTNEKKLDTNTIIVAMSALRFLYKITLKKNWSLDEVIPVPKKPQKLPVILSPEEVRHFLDCVPSAEHRTILTTCYAAGLRLSEAVALTPHAIDSKRMVIRVEQGKGQKDRYTMLSPRLLEILRAWWRVERPKDWLFPGNSGQHISKEGWGRVPEGPSDFENSETHHTPFAAPRLRLSPARTRYRRPQDSTPARASQFGHNRKILVHGDQQSLLHHESPGFAASHGFDGGEPHTVPILLIAHFGGAPEAGSGGHLPPLR